MKKYFVFVACVVTLCVLSLVVFSIKRPKTQSELIPPHYTGVKIEAARDSQGYVFLDGWNLSAYINSATDFLEPAPDLETEDWLYRITFGTNYALGADESYFSEDSELIQICVYLCGLSIDDKKFVFSDMSRHDTFLHDIGVKFDIYSEDWYYTTPTLIP